jgi:uncharacterized membrane protein YheB (UPF0754 family)
MAEDLVLRALLMIGFGALAGGLTNSVAIWMLFHPYEPLRIGRWRIPFFQGAVPKNQARLAAAIGRTVGGRLLTEDDLTRTFARPEFRQAFDQRLADFLGEVLHRNRGTLREILPPEVIPRVESLLDDLVEHVLERWDAYVRSERFETAVAERTGDLVSALSDTPIGGILTPAREEAIRHAADEWLAGVVESDDFGGAVEDYLERAAGRLLEPERTFEDILPMGLVSSFEKAIQGYLPLAIERLGSLLEDAETRARFESTLHDLFHRFLRDLKFHQRVVARLVVTEETLDRILDTIEKEGAERLGELLQDPTVQRAMAAGVNDAVVDFLRRPVTRVLGEVDSENVLEARATMAGWAVNLARDPATRAFLVEKLDQAMDSASARTWGDLLDRLPAEKVTAGLVSTARSETATRIAREALTSLAGGFLDRRIGTPSEWLPSEAPAKIEEALGDPLWAWLQTQVPDVVQRLDVGRRVEEKVLEFPTAQMEALVRRVTQRELKLIVRLGYVLGGLVGSVLVVIDLLLS